MGMEVLFKKLFCLYKVELLGCNEILEIGLWFCLNLKIVFLIISDCINVVDDIVGVIV